MNHITHFVPNTDGIYAKFDEGNRDFTYSRVLFFAITEYPDSQGLGMNSSVEPIIYFQSGEIDSAYDIHNFSGLVPEKDVDRTKVY